MLAAIFALFFICSSFISPHIIDAKQRELAGRVVGITDGDTLTLLTEEKKQIRIRLSEIDAPERRQPYGTKARELLSDLCFGKTVTAIYDSTDRNGRVIARLHTGGTDINAEMVRRGGAWVYRKYSKDKSLLALEAKARNAGRGLWALPEDQRIPPWEWRTLRSKR